MHNNYHFLKILSKQLGKELIGHKIDQVFSQSKNELIIGFYDEGKQSYLKAHLSPEFCCLSFPDTFTRAKRNSVDLFQDVTGKSIKDVVQIANDRSFYLEMTEDYRILFKMHGNRSNVILLNGQKVAALFKSSLKQDANININALSKAINFDLQELDRHEGDYNKLVPTLGKAFHSYFESKNYYEATRAIQYQILSDLLIYLESPQLYLHYDSNGLPQLSLVRIGEDDVSYDSPKKLLNQFFSRYLSISALLKGKTKLRHSINQQLKKLDIYINNGSAKLQKLEHAASYQHLGDLIMANLHQIKPFASECFLMDFYSQEKTKVLLKKNLTPQLNAENYYRKAKRQKIEIETLEKNIKAKTALHKELAQELEALEHVTSLKNFPKQSVVQSKPSEKQYHIVEIMGHEVLIGKNAAKNDLLTFKVARKDDLFLHAKGTAGSHVIVRKKSSQNFPKAVIEQAASLAAFYSKNKNESLCSVLYTPRKHVRKAKGGPAGAVIVEKEKVILVKPRSLEEF